MSKEIEYKGIDYIIIGVSVLLTTLSFVYASIEYSDLPNQIPTHFNGSGEIDGHGDKSTIWYLIGLFTTLTIGLFFLAKNTSFHKRQLKTKTANFRSMAIFMPFMSLIHVIAVYSMIESAKGTFNYSKWILPVILVITAIFITLMFIIIRKNK